MKIAVYGYGTMGKIVAQKLEEKEGIRFIGAVSENESDEKICFSKFQNLKEKPDVLIDFSHFSKIDEILKYCLDEKVALFIATTGHTEEQKEKISASAKEIPILLASNTSLGVNLLNELIGKIVPVLKDWDIELIEKHHNKKVDSPSGTARTLLEKVQEALESERVLKYGRVGMEKRDKNEIGVHAIRGGTIVGEHSLIFAGEDEVIELKHEAHSKQIFANGAVTGAIWLGKKEKGFYTMKDVLFM